MSFPGASPFPLIGHTGEFAWSGTTANGDNADTFAEQLCDPAGGTATVDSDHYLYQGECIAFTHRDQVLHTPLSPTDPNVPQQVTLRTMRSVHGPVHSFATSGGTPYALVRSTAVSRHGVRSLVAFLLIAEGTVHTPQQFVQTMHHYTGNENWFYVSSEHIGWLQSGWFPQHAPGTDLEQPIKGTGAWDWKGFDPARRLHPARRLLQPDGDRPGAGLPLLLEQQGRARVAGRAGHLVLRPDPPRRAPARPHGGGDRGGEELTLADLVGISGNASTQDLRGVAVLPDLLTAFGPTLRMRAWPRSGPGSPPAPTGATPQATTSTRTAPRCWSSTRGGASWCTTSSTRSSERRRDAAAGGIDLVLDGRAVRPASTTAGTARSPTSSAPPSARTAHRRAPLRDRQPRSAVPCFCPPSKAAPTSRRRRARRPVHLEEAALCPDEKPPTCDENRPITAGAIATPSQPLENRGTFHQAVEVLGPLSRPAVPTPPTVPPTKGTGGLAATGSTPLAGALGLLLLGVAWTLRRRSARG